LSYIVAGAASAIVIDAILFWKSGLFFALLHMIDFAKAIFSNFNCKNNEK
jgi:hypothetical protein